MYLALYSDQSGPVARWIKRGFACTRDELPREVATHCRALGALGRVEFSYCDNHALADATATATGRRLKIGREA